MVSVVFQCGWTFQCDFQFHILIPLPIKKVILARKISVLRQDCPILLILVFMLIRRRSVTSESIVAKQLTHGLNHDQHDHNTKSMGCQQV